MDFSLRVDEEHFAYLKLQKGSLDKYSDNRAHWHAAYEADLATTFEEIRPHLPTKCARVLDVGSGLGGIDVLIRRHYEARGQKIGVALLDGISDPPVMNLHRETFNDMRIARNFQVKNGLSPLALSAYGPDVSAFDERFDLVVSFGSWCFHYEPAAYLRQIAAALEPGAVVILEVRARKKHWLHELEATFGVGTEITRRPKWARWMFRGPRK